MERYKETLHDKPSSVKEHRNLSAGFSYSAVRYTYQKRRFENYPFVVEWQLNNADQETKSNV